MPGSTPAAAIVGEKYADAERFLRKNGWIACELQLPRDETRIALAVVLPEIVRFNALEDDIQVRGMMPRRRFHIALVLPATTYSYADFALFFFRSQAGRAAGSALIAMSDSLALPRVRGDLPLQRLQTGNGSPPVPDPQHTTRSPSRRSDRSNASRRTVAKAG